jgi:hypothetical protein
MVESIWKPMETAPQDGTYVWLDCGNGRLYLAWWDDEAWASVGSVTRAPGSFRSVLRDLEYRPRAWMPLPGPPLVDDEAP